MKRNGFTLVELAIVLVVIGIIVGMSVKGSELIFSAKLKSEQARVYNLSAVFNLYYSRYGKTPPRYPGDGSCPVGSYVNCPKLFDMRTFYDAGMLSESSTKSSIGDFQYFYMNARRSSLGLGSDDENAQNINTIVSLKLLGDGKFKGFLDKVVSSREYCYYEALFEDDFSYDNGTVTRYARTYNGGSVALAPNLGTASNIVECRKLSGDKQTIVVLEMGAM